MPYMIFQSQLFLWQSDSGPNDFRKYRYLVFTTLQTWLSSFYIISRQWLRIINKRDAIKNISNAQI